jgi:S1-C subfamily serine protease
MSDPAAFAALSSAIVGTVRRATPLVAALDWCGRNSLSAVLWRDGVLVTSEQSLPHADAYTAILPGGARVVATLAGRDPSTNVAILRLDAATPARAPAVARVEPEGIGALVLALGADGAGDATVRIGTVEQVGPAWDSMLGGRIDRLIRLGLRLVPAAEGGPVVDAEGRLLGMSTFGPRGNVLVIPGSTIARVVDRLMQGGRIERGWLGVGLHPVSLPKELAEASPSGAGLMVVNLAEGAPAAGALLPGDILIKIGDTPVATPRAVAAALGPERIGQAVTLTVLRGGQVATPSVTVAARPA